jgi:ML domain
MMAVFAAAQNSVQVSNCNSNSVFKVVDLSVSPTVPVKNENITIHTIYSVPAEVSDGVAMYSCSFNGIPFSPTVDDLCKETGCPISVGNHDEYSSVTVPNLGGKIVCDMKWMNSDQSVSFLCLRTTLKLSAGLRGQAENITLERTKFASNSTEVVAYEPNICLALIVL